MSRFPALIGRLQLAALVMCCSAICCPAHADVTENFADLPAGRLFYLDSRGKGDVVVFLHAASGNSLLFEKQIKPFTKAGYRFIAFDRPGVGQSTRATPPDISATAPLPIQQLMDHLGVERFHLVGVAAGGGVAMQFVLTNPQRVLSMVTSGSIGYVEDQNYSNTSSRLRPPEFRLLPVEFRELGPSYRASNPEGVQRWLELSQRGQPPPTANPPMLATAPPATLGISPGGAKPATLAELGAIRVPTLLMTGDADLYTPPAILRIFKQHMPRAEMIIVPETGHAAQWENPEFFNRAVLKFLRKH